MHFVIDQFVKYLNQRYAEFLDGFLKERLEEKLGRAVTEKELRQGVTCRIYPRGSEGKNETVYAYNGEDFVVVLDLKWESKDGKTVLAHSWKAI